MCPGFTADCLETLEEMAITNREVFLAAGGLEYVYVPCLNASPPWLEALTSIVRRELAGWI
jgi:ferrochelatase